MVFTSILHGNLDIPSGQNRQKNSLKVCIFVNSALKLQCHIIKNTLLQTDFFGDFAHWVV